MRVASDLKYAFRQLRKSPIFAFVAIISLGLGIGANTAIFSLIDAVMMRSLPVRDPQQLQLMQWTSTKWPEGMITSGYAHSEFSYPMFLQARELHAIFSHVIGFAPLGFKEASVALGVHGRTIPTTGSMVSEEFFSGLGVTTVVGRGLSAEDFQAGANTVAVIGYSCWQRIFGGSPAVLGQIVSVNGSPYTIVGVAPPRFTGLQPGQREELWVPIAQSSSLHPWDSRPPGGESLFTSHKWWWLTIVGRLQPGVSDRRALDVLSASFQGEIAANLGLPNDPQVIPHLQLMDGSHGMVQLQKQFSKPLRLLMGVVGAVLLLACVNVATLLLARAANRRREVAVRLATGASRSRLMIQLLTESIFLALLGGMTGFFLAYGGTRALLAFVASGADAVHLEIYPNSAILVFTAVISLVSGILFGVIPAWRLTRVDLSEALKTSSAPGSADGIRRRFTVAKALVMVQVAVTVGLLTAAGLFIRTLINLERQNLGFDYKHLIVFQLDPTQNGLDRTRLDSFYSALLERLRQLPGVQSATAIRLRPLSGWMSSGQVSTDGDPRRMRGEAEAVWNYVGPDFLETMGMSLLSGRGITAQDKAESPRVAVVSRAFAEKFFGSDNPIGHLIRFPQSQDKESYQIVGLCSDSRYSDLREPFMATFYLPYTQNPDLTSMNFEVRTGGNPGALIVSIQHVIHDLNPDVLVTNLTTQEGQLKDSVVSERLITNLLIFFGLLALVLGAIGLHGTMGYSVARRTSEIGVRMALGAQRQDILRMILLESATLVCTGILLGAPMIVVIDRFASTALYGVRATDLVTLASAMAALLLVSLIASWFPARRAASTQPIKALRTD